MSEDGGLKGVEKEGEESDKLGRSADLGGRRRGGVIETSGTRRGSAGHQVAKQGWLAFLSPQLLSEEGRLSRMSKKGGWQFVIRWRMAMDSRTAEGEGSPVWWYRYRTDVPPVVVNGPGSRDKE